MRFILEFKNVYWATIMRPSLLPGSENSIINKIKSLSLWNLHSSGKNKCDTDQWDKWYSFTWWWVPWNKSIETKVRTILYGVVSKGLSMEVMFEQKCKQYEGVSQERNRKRAFQGEGAAWVKALKLDSVWFSWGKGESQGSRSIRRTLVSTEGEEVRERARHWEALLAMISSSDFILSVRILSRRRA